MLDFYLNSNTTASLHKNHKQNKIDSILNKYLKDGLSIHGIMDQIEKIRNAKRLQPEEKLNKEEKERHKK